MSDPHRFAFERPENQFGEPSYAQPTNNISQPTGEEEKRPPHSGFLQRARKKIDDTVNDVANYFKEGTDMAETTTTENVSMEIPFSKAVKHHFSGGVTIDIQKLKQTKEFKDNLKILSGIAARYRQAHGD